MTLLIKLKNKKIQNYTEAQRMEVLPDGPEMRRPKTVVPTNVNNI